MLFELLDQVAGTVCSVSSGGVNAAGGFLGGGAIACSLGNGFERACFGTGPSCSDPGGGCFEVDVAEGDSVGCGRAAG